MKKITTIAIALMLSGCTMSDILRPSLNLSLTRNPADLAFAYEGLHERKDTARLESLMGHNPIREPWCGYFAAAMHRKAGKPIPDNYGLVSAWRTIGRSVPLSLAKRGDVVAFGSHVGFFLKTKGKQVCLISGNYNDKVAEDCRPIKRMTIRRVN